MELREMTRNEVETFVPVSFTYLISEFEVAGLFFSVVVDGSLVEVHLDNGESMASERWARDFDSFEDAVAFVRGLDVEAFRDLPGLGFTREA